ncbi:hypothetical protein HRI_004568900 [Hibiscus trionum]|uniref:Ninja-family protein n=1 Tax=Hibiscus trionum TaxID=183268 RepID=A0A9W7MQG2_HIBTR|nr:hypothetical protein HRI_004568900 [Hibiscus trionum]
MGLKEDEIELELGLSIGGSFGKVEKLYPVKKESKPKGVPVADLGESMVFEPQMKRKIQALRRQEAKKKREEKQQKRGTTISLTCHQNGEFRSKDDDHVTEERECKKSKVVDVNLNPTAYPVFPVQVPYPYPHLQFVPVANGFPYSCVNPVLSWGGGAGNDKVAMQVQAVTMNGGLQTAYVNHAIANGYDSEQNSSKLDERNRKTGSTGSSTYSSSVVSDLQSSSNQGGRSSESVTHTSPCQPEHSQINYSAASNQKGQSEQSCTCTSSQSNDKCSKGDIEKAPWINVTESSSLSPKKSPPKPESRSSSLKSKAVLSIETKTTSSTKDTNKGEIGKPPKPRTPPTHDILRNMRCVSTTGNGPNGKTINGFLHRYTESEVSIICVCHGSLFTPAEFVQHAGGSDLSHPLRHITVIPSAIQQM